MPRCGWVLAVLPLAVGCGGAGFSAAPTADAAEAADSFVGDAASEDSASATDVMGQDAETSDTGPGTSDGAAADSSVERDAGADAGHQDASSDGPRTDSGHEDDGAVDARTADSGGDVGSRDAAADARDSGQGDAEACAPILYFLDGDGDQYGGTTSWRGCSPPDSGTWVTTGGDCDDSNLMVNPGQSAYFAAGYIPTGKTTVSFDYNCDGLESGSGSPPQAYCQVSGLSCVGSGYIEASPVRGGAGVDPLCGSTEAVTCAWAALVCQASAPYTVSPITCH